MQYFKVEKMHLMIKIISHEVLISNLTVVKLLDQKKVWRGKSCQILFSFMILWYINPSLLKKYDLGEF